MQNDLREAMDLWKEIFIFRQEAIKKEYNLQKILDDWPFYKQSGGEQ